MQSGMALERRIGTRERNFAEANKHGFDEEDRAGDQDGNVKQSGGPSPKN
jgi:hypothetical protein